MKKFVLVVEHDLAVLDYLSGTATQASPPTLVTVGGQWLILPDPVLVLVSRPYTTRLCADYICCLYGTPSAYGVVTMPFSVREGINVFLAGFVPTENLRFRDEELNFKLATNTGE